MLFQPFEDGGFLPGTDDADCTTNMVVIFKGKGIGALLPLII